MVLEQIEKYRKEDMTENDILICGHGSGRPSFKKLGDYNRMRYSKKAKNGKRTCLISVKRLKALTDEERPKFSESYKTIIGRNLYNQNLRNFVYSPYRDGKYYSDCSSSGCATFARLGYKVSMLNTAGIYNSSLFETVNVIIKDGHIENPEVLKVGDCLLYVGNDPSRPLQIGHVEYVYSTPRNEKRYTLGWNKDDIGYWYADTEKTYLKDCFKDINGYRYYFNEDGYMLKGWFMVKDKWYYAESKGELEGALYRSSSDGAMKIWEIG